jgi:NodT family efflux transporter outer membrane factor (OMF) lipoprotein
MRWLAGACCLALTGCLLTVGPDYEAPEIETPPAYSQPVILHAGAAETARWWRGYGDPALDGLVDLALAENLDIAAAEARLREARALVGAADAAGGPTLDIGSSIESERVIDRERRSNQQQRGGTNSGFGSSNDEGSSLEGAAEAGLYFSWLPDLFGGQRRGIEAAEAELRERALLRDDLARTTVADVVRRYLEFRRDEVQLELIEASLDLQRQTFDLVDRRYQAGLASQLDVSRAEAQLAATQALRGPLRQNLAASRSALAVLTGRQPGTQAIAAGTAIPVFLGGPPLGLPRDLLRARPDVQAAEAVLARATAEIGVAEAELYPMLSIPGNLTWAISGLGSGEVIESLIATLAIGLDIPLFDAGGRRAQVAAAEARSQEALFLYRRILLDALGEVEVALANLSAAQARRDDLQAAADAGARAATQAEQLYAQGLTGFLDVLDAQRTLLDNRQDLAESEAAVSLAIADLYSAVGAPVRDNDGSPPAGS